MNVTRAWRYEGFEGGIEDGLILVDGEQIGGTYHCEYNPAGHAGWGHNDGPVTGDSWASYGPRGYSFGHATREAAEQAQVREYATNPDLYDRLNAQDRAEQEADRLARAAAETARIAELDAADRKRRLGDDEPGPTVWTLPAYHALYAPMSEVDAVSEWLRANGVDDALGDCEIRVEQRATRKAIVYKTYTASASLVRALGGRERGMATETHATTLATEPPVILTPARPELHELLEQHWPAKFPLIDFGQNAACGHCTREAGATITADMVLWPCPAVSTVINGDDCS